MNEVKDLRSEIFQHFIRRRITFLGAGPMSPICVESTIELANFYKKPIALIPSRRQIEAKSLGGGYVNRWSTEEFAKFVRDRDFGGFIKLSRDHSGPWQFQFKNSVGEDLSHAQAMSEVKESLTADIKSGFDLIHIDPSQGLKFGRSECEVEDDIYELLHHCQSISIKSVQFEIGADEQSSRPELVTKAEEKLKRILKKIESEKLPKPLFYVLQTGTKVMELRNIGSFDSKLPVSGLLPASVQLPEIIRMCERNNILLKEHNADYLSNKALSWHPRFGVHAANVAPEFGVAETRALINLARENDIGGFADAFSEHVLLGKKWEKWMLPNSTCDDYQRVLIGGHYHFADDQIIELRKELASKLLKKGVSLEKEVKFRVKCSIDRYLRWFGYA
jgi:hypothetical protein